MWEPSCVVLWIVSFLVGAYVGVTEQEALRALVALVKSKAWGFLAWIRSKVQRG
jgi:hypothetical protein